MECLKIQTSISAYRIFTAFPMKMYIEKFKRLTKTKIVSKNNVFQNLLSFKLFQSFGKITSNVVIEVKGP